MLCYWLHCFRSSKCKRKGRRKEETKKGKIRCLVFNCSKLLKNCYSVLSGTSECYCDFTWCLRIKAIGRKMPVFSVKSKHFLRTLIGLHIKSIAFTLRQSVKEEYGSFVSNGRTNDSETWKTIPCFSFPLNGHMSRLSPTRVLLLPDRFLGTAAWKDIVRV